MILIVDFGSQFAQLIARKGRELGIYTAIFPFQSVTSDLLKTLQPSGIILSGSSESVYDVHAPTMPECIMAYNVPVLGICYGQQLLCSYFGGMIAKRDREFGRAVITAKESEKHPLLQGFFQESMKQEVWMSHGDSIINLPMDFRTMAYSEDHEYAIIANDERRIYGVQFHPEVIHTINGSVLLENFAKSICKIEALWKGKSIVQEIIKKLKESIPEDAHVICALSGGVDSTVTATLISNLIGPRLHCIFVDHGMLRKNESSDVRKMYEKLDLNVHYIDASGIFFKELHNITDPEQKRKIIGRLFIEIFKEQACEIEERLHIKINYLAQGTIYPDVIESASTASGKKIVIKSHHNVGGLPENINLTLVEPLRNLFKDEVRAIGRLLDLDNDFLFRHPFPGPGLAVRILGEITKEKCRLLQEADAIFIEELKHWDLYNSVWQAYAALPSIRTVGVMGDDRTYEQACILRAVVASDGMTADFAHLPYDFLAHVTKRIINEVSGINRILYDITSKPPASIELE